MRTTDAKCDLLIEVLTECLEYFENRQDADFNTEDGFIPNKEMMMASKITEALEACTEPPLTDVQRSVRDGTFGVRSAT